MAASKFQNIADEAISAGDSAIFIIAQMTAFHIEAENAEHIMDAVNEASNNFSASSADLANNLGNASAALPVGNNYNIWRPGRLWAALGKVCEVSWQKSIG